MTKRYVIGNMKSSTMSRASYLELLRSAIKIWHFEKTDNGVKPVEGKYDPTNPNHVEINKVIRVWLNGKNILRRDI